MRIHTLLEQELDGFIIKAKNWFKYHKCFSPFNSCLDFAVYLALRDKYSLIGQLERRFEFLVGCGFFRGYFAKWKSPGIGQELWRLFLQRCDTLTVEDIMELEYLSYTEKMLLLDNLDFFEETPHSFHIEIALPM